jgi:RimJ/RimL family protein N-acetyltransferase
MVRAVRSRTPQYLRGINIASDRLVLRSFQVSDAGTVFAAIDPTFARFMVWDPPTSQAAFQATAADWEARILAGTDLPLLVRLKTDDAFLGMATVQNLETPEPRMGVWLREGAQGKGFGREAGQAVLQWAATTLGFVALHYPVVAGDTPSRRLAEALGGVKGETRIHRKASGVELRVMDFRIPTK